MPKAEVKTKEILKDIKEIEKLKNVKWDTKVPKIIHYMWLGDNPKSEEVLQNIESWKKHNPDFEIIEWNDSNFDVNCCLFTKEALSHKKYAFVSDWVRLYGLKNYGGIWLDTDVEVIKPFGDLMNLDGFMSFENEAYLQSAVIGCKKNSEWVEKVFNYYNVRPFIKKGKIDDTPNTVIISALLHHFYKMKYKNKLQTIENQLTLLPNDYLAPKDYTTGEITITLNTLTIHKFASSWFSKGANFQAKFLRGLRKVLGKKIFGLFTLCYMKSIDGKYIKEYKKLVENKK